MCLPPYHPFPKPGLISARLRRLDKFERIMNCKLKEIAAIRSNHL